MVGHERSALPVISPWPWSVVYAPVPLITVQGPVTERGLVEPAEDGPDPVEVGEAPGGADSD